MTTTKPVTPVEPPAAEPEPPEERPRRGFLRRWRYDFVGMAFAIAFFCLSVTPSLLPRSWLLQGAISGILTATGYGLGVLIEWLARRWIARVREAPPPGPHAWRILAVVGGILILVFLYLGSTWQRDIYKIMGMQPPGRPRFLGVLLVAALLFAAFVGLGRLLRKAARWVARILGRWIPPVPARLLGILAAVLLTVLLFNGVIVNGLMSAVNTSFKTINGETSPGVSAPTDPNRSGGPGSLASWASLGNQGRTFIAGGPTTAELRQFNGAEPKAPIRVYTGLESAPSAHDRAALAVRELQRTGAFSRKVLCVITTTGTGWVNLKAVDPLEYMYNGDTALVGMQYSYLPSWLSFLVDKARAREAGRELFNQVYDAWSKVPEGQRPKLVAFGESLGSFGAESAFSGSADMSNRTSGMLLVGPPNANTLWTDFVTEREPNTRMVLPTYEQGETVRFGNQPSDLNSPSTPWGKPRVVYMQHPSDPIVWWSPRLMLHRPDWLNEKRGADVLPNMRWYPFVTFWQVTADMVYSTGVPPGHGHSYGTQSMQAWVDIAPPDGWTAAKTAALEPIIANTKSD
jgi:uncharacterized membrane protein